MKKTLDLKEIKELLESSAGLALDSDDMFKTQIHLIVEVLADCGPEFLMTKMGKTPIDLSRSYDHALVLSLLGALYALMSPKGQELFTQGVSKCLGIIAVDSLEEALTMREDGE